MDTCTKSYHPTQLAKDMPEYLCECIRSFSLGNMEVLIRALRSYKQWCDDDVRIFLESVGLRRAEVSVIFLGSFLSSWKEEITIKILKKSLLSDWV